MVSKLVNIDKSLFNLINYYGHTHWLDVIMPYWRNPAVWIPLYLFGAAFLLFNFGKRGLILLLFTVGTLVMTDQVSSTLIKHQVERLRPCNDPSVRENVKLLVACGGGYSFTSSHAANHTGLAVFVFLTFFFAPLWLRILLIAWGVSIGYAQIYVGLHYPGDVLGGIVVGIGCAFIMKALYRAFTAKYPQWACTPPTPSK